MGDDKTPALTRSAPPREPITQIELLITLDRIRRDIEAIRSDLATAKDNDKRFEKMEHDFRVAKWFTIVAGGAALIALVNAVAGRMSVRLPEPVPQTRSSDP